MTTKRGEAMKIASRSSMDAEHGHFESSPTYSQPAFAPARLLEITRATLARTELDLSGLTILTEAATGAYCVTPVGAWALRRPADLALRREGAGTAHGRRIRAFGAAGGLPSPDLVKSIR